MNSQPKISPLISYYGGKQRIASKIVERIRQIPHTVYAEPFAGGLAVLFAKGKPAVTNISHYREAVNDHDDRLITLYRVARTQPDELQRWIDLTPYSQSEHTRAKQWLKEPGHTELELAWAYYVSIQMSFSNDLGCGWRTGVMTRNQAATWSNKQQRLPEAMERLRSVHIACEDAIRFIQRWDSPQTLFYCDPPYPGANQGHYGGYTLEDWQRLCDALDNCQGSYILSNYDQPTSPQSAHQRVEIRAVASAQKVKRDRTRKVEQANNERVEVLWICDRSANVRADLAPVLQRIAQAQEVTYELAA